MVDAAEVVADVGIEHVMAPFGSKLSQSLKSHRRAALGPKAVRARQEIRLEDRLQHQLPRHLHYPVPYRRDPQRSLSSIGLRYVPSPNHLRSVLTRLQLGGQFLQEPRYPVLLDPVDGLAVHSGGAAVRSYSPPRLPQDVTPVDMVI